MSTEALQRLLEETNSYPTAAGSNGFQLTRDRLIAILQELSPSVAIGAHDLHHYEDSGDATTMKLTVYMTLSRSELGMPNRFGVYKNQKARDGYDKCPCGCKYWENDRCIDCGTHVDKAEKEE